MLNYEKMRERDSKLCDRTNMHPYIPRRAGHILLILPPSRLTGSPAILILLPDRLPQNLPRHSLARKELDRRFYEFLEREFRIYTSSSLGSDKRLNNRKVGEGKMDRSDDGDKP